MTTFPCYRCGEVVPVSLDLELEVAICETCAAEFYDVHSLEEVLV